jgi:uncharacterized protein YcaQ
VPQLREELGRMSAWLGLARVAPRGRGELVRALRNA